MRNFQRNSSEITFQESVPKQTIKRAQVANINKISFHSVGETNTSIEQQRVREGEKNWYKIAYLLGEAANLQDAIGGWYGKGGISDDSEVGV